MWQKFSSATDADGEAVPRGRSHIGGSPSPIGFVQRTIGALDQGRVRLRADLIRVSKRFERLQRHLRDRRQTGKRNPGDEKTPRPSDCPFHGNA